MPDRAGAPGRKKEEDEDVEDGRGRPATATRMETEGKLKVVCSQRYRWDAAIRDGKMLPVLY